MRQINEDERDALFAAWMEDRESAVPAPLGEWVERYPDCAGELISWAADAPVLNAAERRSPDAEAEQKAIASGLQTLARFLQPLDSLLGEARARGRSPKALAEEINISPTLLARLQQRLIAAGSIPDTLVAGLSSALGRSTSVIREYLARPAMLAQSASYKSDRVPQAASQESFLHAVLSAPDLTETQRQYWLDQGHAP